MGHPTLTSEFVDVKIFVTTPDIQHPMINTDHIWLSTENGAEMVTDFHHNPPATSRYIGAAFRDHTGFNILPIEQSALIIENIFWGSPNELWARMRFCVTVLGDAAQYDMKVFPIVGGIFVGDDQIDDLTGEITSWKDYIVYFGFASEYITSLTRPFGSIV